MSYRLQNLRRARKHITDAYQALERLADAERALGIDDSKLQVAIAGLIRRSDGYEAQIAAEEDRIRRAEELEVGA